MSVLIVCEGRACWTQNGQNSASCPWQWQCLTKGFKKKKQPPHITNLFSLKLQTSFDWRLHHVFPLFLFVVQLSRELAPPFVELLLPLLLDERKEKRLMRRREKLPDFLRPLEEQEAVDGSCSRLVMSSWDWLKLEFFCLCLLRNRSFVPLRRKPTATHDHSQEKGIVIFILYICADRRSTPRSFRQWVVNWDLGGPWSLARGSVIVLKIFILI